uniref:Integrase catalytic domain-containing protein n=1 Tax=Tanacetum cinerariifolium TaxID=118510 RepID=A0A6L2LZQ3_TANCI|nr:hypothetical protein [Tanacetum cinerariifolium]
MLERGSYIPWASRFPRYINRKIDYQKWLNKALDEGPYQFQMFVPSDSTVLKLQTAEDLQGDALLHYDAKIEVMNLILVSILNDIYNSVDACTSAKDIWKSVERLMRGTIQNKVDKETPFINKFDHGKGHYARNFPKPRVRDSKYFMEQMLLAKQDEAGVILTDEQNNFLFADASRIEEIKDLGANIFLMPRIQPTNHSSDVGPSYDSAFVYFLHLKDETPEIIKKFIAQAQMNYKAKLCKIHTNNGTEFINATLKAHYEKLGIIQQFSTAHTPQQNRLVERRNRTLVEAARTMLIFSRLPKFLWAEAVATTCFTQNWSIIHTRYTKTPYELLHGQKPNVEYFYVFGSLCYPTNDRVGLVKMKPKADIGVFIEPMNTSSKEDLDNLFGPMFEEYFRKKSSDTPINFAAQPTQCHEDSPSTSLISVEDTIEPKNIKEAMVDYSWIESIKDELNQLERLQVWELILRPKGKNIIALKWLWKNKSFLNGPLTEEVYVSQPEGFINPKFPNHVYRLKKALYGLKHAPRSWYEKLSSFLIEHGFIKGIVDPTLFTRHHGGDILLVQKHGLDEYVSMSTHMATERLDADLQGTPTDQTTFRQMIGGLMYLIGSRLDIAYATFVCARYQAHPMVKHLKAVKRIFRYLKQSYNKGLWYSKDFGFELIAYSYADHAGCKDDCKSTSGGLQFLGGNLVSWSLKKQDCTAMSTAEAEYYNRIPMYCDSKSAIAISYNLVQHSKTKHIDIRYHFIKEHVEKGTVELYFVGTKYQLADLFTKERFEYLVHRIVIIMAHQRLVADFYPDELCPPNKRYDLMDATKKIDLEHLQCPSESKILTNIIKNHPLRFSIEASLSVPWIYMAQFWHTLKEDGSKYKLKFMLDRKELSLTLDDFKTIFHLPQATDNNHDRFVPPPLFSYMIPFYKNHLRFTMELKTSSSFKTIGLLQSWKTLCKIFSKCLTTRVTRWDQSQLQIMKMIALSITFMEIQRQSWNEDSRLDDLRRDEANGALSDRSIRLTPPTPVPMVDKADELILQDTLQMVEGQENVVDGSSIPRNDEHNILDTRLEPRSDKKSLEVEVTNVVILVNVYDEEEEKDKITNEVYELKRREKEKIVEKSRNRPFPTPIRSPRIHVDLVSSDTEKLQELTITTPLSSSPNTKFFNTNRLLAKFMPRKSFVTLANHLHEAMVDSLPSMVDKHVKEQVQQQVPEQVQNQVPIYVAEGLILEKAKEQ